MPDPSTISAAAKAIETASRFRPWATVRRHDRLVNEIHEDWITWARDDLKLEARALDDARADMGKRNLLYSGLFGQALQRIRDDFAQRWRDQRRGGERKLAEIREAETASVLLWRKLARRPWPANAWEAELRTIVQAWEDEDVRRRAVENEVTPRLEPRSSISTPGVDSAPPPDPFPHGSL